MHQDEAILIAFDASLEAFRLQIVQIRFFVQTKFLNFLR